MTQKGFALYRYFTLISDALDTRSNLDTKELAAHLRRTSNVWSLVVDTEEVKIFAAGHGSASRTHVLPRKMGAVLGTIFLRHCDDPIISSNVTFDEEETSKIVDSAGKHLLEHYWGRFVAIFRDTANRRVMVLRDPTGTLPCFMARWRSIHLIFSDYEDCISIAPSLPVSINWTTIARVVTRQATTFVQDTALNGVSEILPGELACFLGTTVQRSIEWNPIDIALSNPIENIDSAVESLHRSVHQCVHTWAACYPSIVHRLSGGLDSSIVLSCLTSAPTQPSIIGLNYFGNAPGEDERNYAEMMAAHTGVKLIKQKLDHKIPQFESILDAHRTPRPWGYLYELEHGQFEAAVAAHHGMAQGGISGIFSGTGGDSIFCRGGANYAVTDYLFQHGLRSHLLAVAIDAARISHQSIWPFLITAVRTRARLGQAVSTTNQMPPLVCPMVHSHVFDAIKPSVCHPWLTNTNHRSVPPGIFWHASASVTPPAYYKLFSSEKSPENIFPLLSQPLVELCLRIPIFLHIQDGQDRAVARRTFINKLPTPILLRSQKGHINQHLRDLFDRNLTFVRSLMIDGELVRNNILNRDILEYWLTSSNLRNYKYFEFLCEHICTEVWLRNCRPH